MRKTTWWMVCPLAGALVFGGAGSCSPASVSDDAAKGDSAAVDATGTDAGSDARQAGTGADGTGAGDSAAGDTESTDALRDTAADTGTADAGTAPDTDSERAHEDTAADTGAGETESADQPAASTDTGAPGTEEASDVEDTQGLDTNSDTLGADTGAGDTDSGTPGEDTGEDTVAADTETGDSAVDSSDTAASYAAPCDVPGWQEALAVSKLQAPTSTTAATAEELLSGYTSGWFYVIDGGVGFYQEGDSQRTELRFLDDWTVDGSHALHAELRIVTQECDQLTVLQIHDDANADDGPNKPLLRVYHSWSKSPGDHLWAAIKTDAGGDDTVHLDLGPLPDGYVAIDIQVVAGVLRIAVGGDVLVERDVSYWSYLSYWKAGVYLQDDGAALVVFRSLSWN